LFPDQSTPSRPRAVDTISDARPTKVPCSVGLPGGVKESRADGATVDECGFCASTDAGADVGGEGTARDTCRRTEGEWVFGATRTCLSSSVVDCESFEIGIESVGFGDIERAGEPGC
jgi:hypothetical protein